MIATKENGVIEGRPKKSNLTFNKYNKLKLEERGVSFPSGLRKLSSFSEEA
jgi:hypothetical protein